MGTSQGWWASTIQLLCARPRIAVMNSKPQQLIVTGAAGWLGRRLVSVLANGFEDPFPQWQPQPELEIRALIHTGEDPSAVAQLSDRVRVTAGDIHNPADCARLCHGAKGATLVHTAGIIHPRRVREFYEVNRDGTRNMLEAAAVAGMKRAVIVSSNSPCGCNPSTDHRFDEQSPYNPYMNYGRSKMEMERIIQSFQASGAIETVIIRAPWFYGPFQPPRQTLFFQMIRDGKMPIVGDGTNVRSLAYIDNLCQGLILAALNPAANGLNYWIADERAYSMNEIVDTVEELLEKEFNIPCAHKRMRLPWIVGQVAMGVDALIQSLGFYHQKIHVLSEMNKNIACSIERARTELNYRPVVALREGMRRSIRWCLESGLL